MVFKSGFWAWRFSWSATIAVLVLMLALLTIFYRPMLIGPRLDLQPGGYFIFPLAIGLLSLIGLLGLFRPDLLLVLSIASIPWAYRSRGFWDSQVLFINDKYFPLHEILLWMSVLASMVWMTTSSVRTRTLPRIKWHALILPSLWMLVGLIALGMASVEKAAAAREWRWTFLEPLIMYLLIRYWAHRRNTRWLIVAGLLIGGAIITGIALLQRQGIDLTPTDGTGRCYSDFLIETGGTKRTSSLFCHPNNLSLWLDRIWPLALVLAGGLFISRRPAWKKLTPPLGWHSWTILSSLVALLTIIGMMYTYSKGARFAGAFVLIGLSLLSRRWWIVGTTTIILAGLLTLSSVSGPERLNIGGDSSFARLSLWRSAAHMIADHPAGLGLDQFFSVYTNEYIEADYKDTEATTSHPHNFILDLWLRIGPWGLVIFGIIIWRTWWRGWRTWCNSNPERWLALALLAAGAVGILHGFVDQVYFSIELAMITWVLIGLIDVMWELFVIQEQALIPID